ncbi:MAG: hypothetical protein MK538_17000 [Planctomycetes bacterium]|nr:hypothetical protein [Planctomycetota bacterium]
MRVLTYNLHKKTGGIDRTYRPEHIVEVHRLCDTDFVFLQAVAEGALRSPRSFTLGERGNPRRVREV